MKVTIAKYSTGPVLIEVGFDNDVTNDPAALDPCLEFELLADKLPDGLVKLVVDEATKLATATNLSEIEQWIVSNVGNLAPELIGGLRDGLVHLEAQAQGLLSPLASLFGKKPAPAPAIVTPPPPATLTKIGGPSLPTIPSAPAAAPVVRPAPSVGGFSEVK